ncbi:proline racemase family protein [Sediminibacillus massiliensis]|uniref:proline racemase family protein n=1 Tax=Sediminibacillus massiliensis TaxID=1926277 RepID=UPI0009884A1B|nr:proline racemase family protein [Sediminibacillus massiliensis]
MKVNHYINTVDVHAAGESIRILDMDPLVKRKTTMQEYRKELNGERFSGQWKTLLEEPRGHNEMKLCIITPPVTEDADAGVLFRNVDGELSNLNYGAIGVATVLAEVKNIIKDKYVFDSLTGQVEVFVQFDDEKQQVKEAKVVESSSYKEQVNVKGTEINIFKVNGEETAVIDSSYVDVVLSVNHLKDVKEKAVWLFEQNELNAVSKLLIVHGTSPRQITHLAIDRNLHIERSPYRSSAAHIGYLLQQSSISRDESNFKVVNFLNNQVECHVLNYSESDFSFNLQIDIRGKGFITGLHRFVIDHSDPLMDGFLVK